MRKELQKKLKNYSLATGAILAAGVGANAQVVYTDIEDVTLVATAGGVSYELDVNNDLTTDFIIENGKGSSSAVDFLRFWPAASLGTATVVLNGNEALGSTSASGAYFNAFALNLNDPINDTEATWNGTINAGAGTLAWGAAYGNWAAGATDKYIGFRFKIAPATTWNYGWVRLDATANGASVTVKDYAYETAADTEILAGELAPSSIKNLNNANLTVFPNPSNGKVNVNVTDNKQYSVKVVNVLGQVIMQNEIDASNNSIDLTSFSKGLYQLILNDGSVSTVKNIVVE